MWHECQSEENQIYAMSEILEGFVTTSYVPPQQTRAGMW